MSRAFVTALVILMGTAVPTPAALRVVATTPEHAALAAAVGGDRVSVTVIARATEDPHFVDARPTHIVALNRADLLIHGGAELESGWLPPLPEGARNPRILPGAPGNLAASHGIQLLDIPAAADRSLGDIHLAGNPHFMMDPENARIVARHIADVLTQLDPSGGTSYGANLARFEEALDAKTKEWTALLAPLRGTPVVTYHSTWRYFAARFGLRSDTYLEPKPGIPPSPPHLAQIIGKMKADGIRVILVEPFQPHRTAEAVAAQTGAAVVDVCQFPGGLPGTEGDYLRLMDANGRRVAAALAAARN